MAAVMKVLATSATHYVLIGIGTDVKVFDLMPLPGAADANLMLVFQRWFDADTDVNWDTLIKLCNNFPNELAKAKSHLAYIGKLRTAGNNVLYYTRRWHYSPLDGQQQSLLELCPED
uniref:Uncharacterized protein n=1 Tax=Amphimedon queenslandica TaxID=400682 RepID=A0A1X7U781_AMPQE